MIATPLERYRPIIDDWDAFSAAVQRPLPTTIWTNSLRITPEALATLMAGSGIVLEPLPWLAGAFRLPSGVSPGLRWEYLAGLYHVQEEVSLLPALLLDVQPTDRVLDLCAAPGNKTAQLGVLMGNRGTVVANDRSTGRMRAARQVLNRLGLVNVTVLTQDAANLPRALGQFDKILADVPCTCEGTCRKSPEVLKRVNVHENRKLARVQQAILRKAVQRCRPGGRIVYATCTFAPEENELVVADILNKYDGRVRLLPIRLPHFQTMPGLTRWQDEDLPPSLAHCARVWPHHNDTGGFFVALLEKMGEDVESPPPAEPLATTFSERLEPDPWLETVSEQYGFPPAHFDDYNILRWGKRGVWLANKDARPSLLPRPDSVGTMFMRTQGRYPKLTTGAAMLFGRQATRRCLDLTAAQAKAFYTRQEFDLTPAQQAECPAGSGYMLLRYQGHPIGVGVYRAERAAIESQFPKGWMRAAVEV